MLRRRPILRTAVGTAVVAGTATAVSGRVAGRQDARRRADAAASAGEGATPVMVTERDSAAQLGELASLREQGVLTEAEFQTEKARILAHG